MLDAYPKSDRVKATRKYQQVLEAQVDSYERLMEEIAERPSKALDLIAEFKRRAVAS